MKLYLSSGNPHKTEEFQALSRSSGLALEILSAQTVGGMPQVVEDAGTFVGNARKKALALKALVPAEAWVLADDSGICVDALAGAPGVESAYYAGPAHDAVANLRKLTETMRGVPQGERGAQFVCVLLLLGAAGVERIFEGRCHGRLGNEPLGGSGFGYDPLFVPEGFDKTYAQLSDAEKNQISHRGKAWTQMAEWLRPLIGKE